MIHSKLTAALHLCLSMGIVCAVPAAASEGNEVSPVRKIEREAFPTRPSNDREVPSIDGSGNNLQFPQYNAAGQQLKRRFAPAYADQISQMAGDARPSARMISNLVHDQSLLAGNPQFASDYLWQWGQFIDHDIDLTDGVAPAEAAPIAVPMGDPEFDPGFSGTAQINLNRSIYDHESGTSADNPRQQVNEITGWLDGSMVYGSDAVRAAALRSFSGGMLLTSEGNLLPFNDAGLPNAGGSGSTLFLAGDVRANEQLGLTAMHTLFVREHNWWAARIAAEQPTLSDEQIYQRARMMVSAEIQAITFRDFLPLLLGADAIPAYDKYAPEVDARISNSFSSAAYRLGHSLLSPKLLRLDAYNQPIDGGHLALREAFFAPSKLAGSGIEPLLRGLAAQRCQTLDVYIIDDVRNFLFGAPGSGGFDLASLNIQRGRDHGLPSYFDIVSEMGLMASSYLVEGATRTAEQERVMAAYGAAEQVDAWTGLLAETPVPGAMVGPTLKALISEQFIALRDGDRFWYQRRLSPEQQAEVNATTLADIIRRNTSIGGELPDDVFRVRSQRGGPSDVTPPPALERIGPRSRSELPALSDTELD